MKTAELTHMRLSAVVAGFDLTAVRGDLIKRDGMSQAQADHAIALYRQFLVLAATTDAPVCPPSAADKVWHRHMLRPAAYREACDALGAIPDHDPDAFGTETFVAAWARTCQLFKERFGVVLDEDPTAADRGDLSATLCLVNMQRAA